MNEDFKNQTELNIPKMHVIMQDTMEGQLFKNFQPFIKWFL